MRDIDYTFDGSRLFVRLERLPDSMRKRIVTTLNKELIRLQAIIKDRYLRGQALHVRTGHLRASITHRVDALGTRVIGTVGTKVVYARIHEYGGQTKPHLIQVRRALALAWFPNGYAMLPQRKGVKTQTGRWSSASNKDDYQGLVFAQWVNHPGSKIPARPFLRPAFKQALPSIIEKIRQAVNAELGGKH